jgi:hypothetical protein
MRMNDSIVMEHFGIDHRFLCDESDEVSKVCIGDVDHGRNGKGESILIIIIGVILLFFLHFSFIIVTRYKLQQ